MNEATTLKVDRLGSAQGPCTPQDGEDHRMNVHRVGKDEASAYLSGVHVDAPSYDPKYTHYAQTPQMTPAGEPTTSVKNTLVKEASTIMLNNSSSSSSLDHSDIESFRDFSAALEQLADTDQPAPQASGTSTTATVVQTATQDQRREETSMAAEVVEEESYLDADLEMAKRMFSDEIPRIVEDNINMENWNQNDDDEDDCVLYVNRDDFDNYFDLEDQEKLHSNVEPNLPHDYYEPSAWRCACTREGKLYYYHHTLREPVWHLPEGISDGKITFRGSFPSQKEKKTAAEEDQNPYTCPTPNKPDLQRTYVKSNVFPSLTPAAHERVASAVKTAREVAELTKSFSSRSKTNRSSSQIENEEASSHSGQYGAGSPPDEYSAPKSRVQHTIPNRSAALGSQIENEEARNTHPGHHETGSPREETNGPKSRIQSSIPNDSSAPGSQLENEGIKSNHWEHDEAGSPPDETNVPQSRTQRTITNDSSALGREIENEGIRSNHSYHNAAGSPSDETNIPQSRTQRTIRSRSSTPINQIENEEIRSSHSDHNDAGSVPGETNIPTCRVQGTIPNRSSTASSQLENEETRSSHSSHNEEGGPSDETNMPKSRVQRTIPHRSSALYRKRTLPSKGKRASSHRKQSQTLFHSDEAGRKNKAGQTAPKDQVPQDKEQCPHCNRKFAPGRLEVHEPVCERVFIRKRHQYDTSSRRLKHTPAEKFQEFPLTGRSAYTSTQKSNPRQHSRSTSRHKVRTAPSNYRNGRDSHKTSQTENTTRNRQEEFSSGILAHHDSELPHGESVTISRKSASPEKYASMVTKNPFSNSGSAKKYETLDFHSEHWAEPEVQRQVEDEMSSKEVTRDLGQDFNRMDGVRCFDGSIGGIYDQTSTLMDHWPAEFQDNTSSPDRPVTANGQTETLSSNSRGDQKKYPAVHVEENYSTANGAHKELKRNLEEEFTSGALNVPSEHLPETERDEIINRDVTRDLGQDFNYMSVAQGFGGSSGINEIPATTSYDRPVTAANDHRSLALDYTNTEALPSNSRGDSGTYSALQAEEVSTANDTDKELRRNLEEEFVNGALNHSEHWHDTVQCETPDRDVIRDLGQEFNHMNGAQCFDGSTGGIYGQTATASYERSVSANNHESVALGYTNTETLSSNGKYSARQAEDFSATGDTDKRPKHNLEEKFSRMAASPQNQRDEENVNGEAVHHDVHSSMGSVEESIGASKGNSKRDTQETHASSVNEQSGLGSPIGVDDIVSRAPVRCDSCGSRFTGAAELCQHLIQCSPWLDMIKGCRSNDRVSETDVKRKLNFEE